MAYPSLPASPTLTNPDMILPHYGEYDSTPSPPQNPMRPLSPPGGWKDSEPDELAFSIGPPGHLPLGVGPLTPTTPIIYGNGTLLSDIGEVTEVESTPGRKGPRQFQTQQATGQDSPLRSSPTMGYNAAKRRTKRPPIHQRTVSVESSSTAATEGHAAETFVDFDDGISMDDSNFQGDDEESVADESDEHRVTVAQTKGTMKESGSNEDEDLNSSIALSRRAELILANAKRRLDNMEGNLTRARSSLYITPSSSMSSMHSGSPLSGSTPSPSDADHRILPQLGVPPAKHRQLNNSSSPAALGHTRVSSENSISSLYKPLQSPRSLSFSTPTPSCETDNKATPRPAHSIPLSLSSSTYNKPLEPLSEDDTLPSKERDGNLRSSTAESYFRDPYLGIPEEHLGLARSNSSVQMRNLTDKVKDLKGKISSLRDRAREDTMKRRSLQSLRAPSPFTVADQWYTIAKAYKNEGLGADVGLAQNAWGVGNEETFPGKSDEKTKGHLTPKAADGAVSETHTVIETIETIEKTGVPEDIEETLIGHKNGATPSEQEDVYETADEEDVDAEVELEDEVDGTEEDDYDDELVNHDELDELDEHQSEGDASLYHDTSSVPLSHEDREDAFDYEHFFLHSAMGTLTEARLRRRGSDGSFSSDDSVETTRGLEAPPAAIHLETALGENSLGQMRMHKSTDSVSTLASFATATEGFYAISAEIEGNVHDHTIRNVSKPPLDQPVTDSTLGKGSSHALPTNIEQPASGQATPETVSRPNSVIRVGSRQNSHMDRPSISSFSSTGTTRSFPLVNKPKTPSLSPEPVAVARASSIPTTANGALNNVPGENAVQSSPVSMLIKDDQILIEQLVASLGKCVLGLQESSRANSEGQLWRRRLEVARRVLEGEEELV